LAPCAFNSYSLQDVSFPENSELEVDLYLKYANSFKDIIFKTIEQEKIEDPSGIDWTKIKFEYLDLDTLEDVNEIPFDTLGKNYKKLKWDKLDFSSLNEESIDAIEWDKVNF